ncbi:MAG: hypothetical protein IKO47_03360 [Ruminococcus sp.]|nr:hypothetical protein [Ruminococcus sp.]
MNKEPTKTGRDIIVSKIQFIPYDPIQWWAEQDELCIAQITIDRINKTATFEHLSGAEPILDVVIDVLAANKHWLKIVDESYEEIENSGKFLLCNPLGVDFFVAHMEGDIPVVEKPLTDSPEFNLSKETFTPLKFHLIAESWFLPTARKTWRYNDHRRYIRKELLFKYIR